MKQLLDKKAVLPDGREALYTTSQALGAIPNGTLILKTNSEPGDTVPDGTTGLVLGSIAIDMLGDDFLNQFEEKDREKFATVKHFYFVTWVETLGVPDGFPIGLLDYKIKIDDTPDPTVEETLEYLASPEYWPHWPLLPMVKSEDIKLPLNQRRLGIALAPTVNEKLGAEPTQVVVLLGNMREVPWENDSAFFKHLNTLHRVVYSSADEVANNWLVD
jgi:hypothetical protein